MQNQKPPSPEEAIQQLVARGRLLARNLILKTQGLGVTSEERAHHLFSLRMAAVAILAQEGVHAFATKKQTADVFLADVAVDVANEMDALIASLKRAEEAVKKPAIVVPPTSLVMP